MKTKTSIVLTGVGGQGVITAANILGKAAVKAGLNVYVSEIHGMAQRGGTVDCTVRIGEVSGALVANGTADVILSTEPIETLRYIKYSNKNTKIITDITPVIPFTVSTGFKNGVDTPATIPNPIDLNPSTCFVNGSAVVSRVNNACSFACSTLPKKSVGFSTAVTPITVGCLTGSIE